MVRGGCSTWTTPPTASAKDPLGVLLLLARFTTRPKQTITDRGPSTPGRGRPEDPYGRVHLPVLAEPARKKTGRSRATPTLRGVAGKNLQPPEVSVAACERRRQSIAFSGPGAGATLQNPAPAFRSIGTAQNVGAGRRTCRLGELHGSSSGHSVGWATPWIGRTLSVGLVETSVKKSNWPRGRSGPSTGRSTAAVAAIERLPDLKISRGTLSSLSRRGLRPRIKLENEQLAEDLPAARIR